MTQTARIMKDTLWQDYYANLKTALSSMRRVFKIRAHDDGLTQDDIAARLNIDKALVSCRLTGEENFTLKTLSFMASAMRCRLQIHFRPYEELGRLDGWIGEDEYQEKMTCLRMALQGCDS